ncbi:hypothetical protein ABZP36_002045, partial [Zizania latifolia]
SAAGRHPQPDCRLTTRGKKEDRTIAPPHESGPVYTIRLNCYLVICKSKYHHEELDQVQISTNP